MKDSDLGPENRSSHILERRSHHDRSLELDSITTSSLKRFQKHINSAIKTGLKSGKEFSLVRLVVLEIEGLKSSPGVNLAKKLDAHCKAKVIELLRKSDRIFSNKEGEYLILMPNTGSSNAQQATHRIVETLADYSFELTDKVIRPGLKASHVTYSRLDCMDETCQSLLLRVGFTDTVESRSGSLIIKGDNIFSGSIEDWLSRYELEIDRDRIEGLMESSLCMDLFVGRDTWKEDGIVVVRVIDLTTYNKELNFHLRKRLLQFLRQVQSLDNVCVTSAALIDFHITNEKIYLVNSVPEFDSTATLLSLPLLTRLGSLEPLTADIRHVLFKLCGAIAYLKSLVPPIVLDNLDCLILLLSGVKDKEAVYVLNHDLPVILKILNGNESYSFEHGKTVISLSSYLLELNRKGQLNFEDVDCDLVEILEGIVTEDAKILEQYNSFAKLKALFKD